jgi:hypothetical protein
VTDLVGELVGTQVKGIGARVLRDITLRIGSRSARCGRHTRRQRARFELETVYGTIPAFDWFRILDAEIVDVRPFYDPRPITSGMERAARAL